MKNYLIRYYVDWTCTKIAERWMMAVSFDEAMAGAKLLMPIVRNNSLLIDITEEK